MSKHVPLISSGIAGPLGVLHLPRLWQKVSLEAAGKLAEGYPGAGQGYDQMVLDGIGIDRQEFIDYVSNNRPTYPDCEKWILGKKGGSLDADGVKKLNDSIIGYNHDDDTRKSILAASGIDDNGTILDAINLNNLDDWQEFHAAELKG